MESKSPANDKGNDVFGCDIGNGFAFLSVLKERMSDPVPMFPAKYKLDNVGMPTSAYIAPPDGAAIEVFSGRPAYEQHRREPERFLHAVKTRLKEGAVAIPGISRPVPPDAVYAAIVRDLIRLGNEERHNRGEDAVYDMVFTFPSSFAGDLTLLNRMQKSIENVQIDGNNIKVLDRLPESAAAAIDYLYYMQHIAPEDIRIGDSSYTVLVYDLGHGTFDAAVVTARSKGEPYRLHFSEGLSDVGGKDFDRLLYDEICRILKADYEYVPKNGNAREAIRLAAIEAKHELSNDDSSLQEFPMPDGTSAEIEISRSKFEEKSRALLYQTFAVVERLMERAKDDEVPVDAVVLSGGASQMPMVINGLRQLLREDDIPVRIYRPSTAVSYGAARYAYGRASEPKTAQAGEPESQSGRDAGQAKASEAILEKYTEYSYGIWMPSDEKLSGIVKSLVAAKVKLPAESASLCLESASQRLQLRLYRSKEKYADADIMEVGECEAIMFIPFDVPPNRRCEVRIQVLEDYNVKVVCKPINAKEMKKSTREDFL